MEDEEEEGVQGVSTPAACTSLMIAHPCAGAPFV